MLIKKNNPLNQRFIQISQPKLQEIHMLRVRQARWSRGKICSRGAISARYTRVSDSAESIYPHFPRFIFISNL